MDRVRGISVLAFAAVLAAASADLRAQDLLGEYWQNATIPGTPGVPAGAPTYTSNDAAIDYDDNTGDATVPNFPVALTPLDNFVCRWTGYILGPTDGAVTFTTLSDDGVHLTVGGTVVINNWTDHAPTTNTGTFTTAAGIWYPIQLQFYEKGGGARIRLSWSYAGQTDQLIPGANQAQTVPTPAQPVLTGSAGDLQATFNTLNWTFAGTASSFTIFRSTDIAQLGPAIATVAGNVLTYTDADPAIQYNITYYYRVAATNGIQGPPSNQLPLTPQPPPARVAGGNNEGLFDDNCACGSTVSRPGGLWAVGLLGLALLLAVRKR